MAAAFRTYRVGVADSWKLKFQVQVLKLLYRKNHTVYAYFVEICAVDVDGRNRITSNVGAFVGLTGILVTVVF